MSQVSCGKFRLRAPLVHGALQLREGPSQAAVITDRFRHDHRQAGAKEAGMDACEKQRRPQAAVGDPIAMGARQPGDQAVQAQASQVVGHPPWRDGARRHPSKAASGATRSR